MIHHSEIVRLSSPVHTWDLKVVFVIRSTRVNGANVNQDLMSQSTLGSWFQHQDPHGRVNAMWFPSTVTTNCSSHLTASAEMCSIWSTPGIRIKLINKKKNKCYFIYVFSSFLNVEIEISHWIFLNTFFNVTCPFPVKWCEDGEWMKRQICTMLSWEEKAKR